MNLSSGQRKIFPVNTNQNNKPGKEQRPEDDAGNAEQLHPDDDSENCY